MKLPNWKWIVGGFIGLGILGAVLPDPDKSPASTAYTTPSSTDNYTATMDLFERGQAFLDENQRIHSRMKSGSYGYSQGFAHICSNAKTALRLFDQMGGMPMPAQAQAIYPGLMDSTQEQVDISCDRAG